MEEQNTNTISGLAAEGTEAKSSGILNGVSRFGVGVVQMGAAALLLEGGKLAYDKITGRGEKNAEKLQRAIDARDTAQADRIVTGIQAGQREMISAITEGFKGLADASKPSS